MTPEYASPEQMSRKGTSTATDVYSLGVVLYELLTGTRPFDFKGKSLIEISDALKTQRPVRPSECKLVTERAADVIPRRPWKIQRPFPPLKLTGCKRRTAVSKATWTTSSCRPSGASRSVVTSLWWN
jgi:serine/threonine protein kinase